MIVVFEVYKGPNNPRRGLEHDGVSPGLMTISTGH